MPPKFFDSVKSSNFCVSLKPSFLWFKTEHGESGESKAVTSIPERKLRLNLVPRVLSLLRESTLVTAGHVSARF